MATHAGCRASGQCVPSAGPSSSTACIEASAGASPRPVSLLNMAAMKVRSGWEDLVVAGGVESMSRVPIGSDGGAWAQDPATNSATLFVPQGIGADLIATLDGYTRADVDAFALESQRRATAARAAGYFKNSVVPVRDFIGQTILAEDEFIKPKTTLEGLGALKASFEQLGGMGFDAVALQRYPQVERIHHVHHAGNSSGIVDGAAGVLIGNKEFGERMGIKPRARIRATAKIGTDPTIMLTGPVPVTEKILREAGMTIGDIDLFEVNEAFAAVVLRFQQAFNVDPAKVFVTGNTVIDALHQVVAKIDADKALSADFASKFPFGVDGRRLILVTGHRRESFGSGFENICAALKQIAAEQA